jgi:hypothetical protein
LYEDAQNFEAFSNIQKLNLKNQKPIAVDILFKAYPMVRTALMKIQSGGTVPSKEACID